MDWELIWNSLPLLIEGAVLTVQISVLAIVLGLALGWLLGLCSVSHSRLLRGVNRAYVEFIRGTPLLVQILLVYFGLSAIGLTLPAFWASVLALGLNSAGFQSEIVRAGIQSIDLGQTEAAKSIGLSATQTLIYLLVPQAVLRVIPPLTNELISLLKGSSLLSAIGVSELTHQGQAITARTFAPIEIYLAVAGIYLVVVGVLARTSAVIEHRIPQF